MYRTLYQLFGRWEDIIACKVTNCARRMIIRGGKLIIMRVERVFWFATPEDSTLYGILAADTKISPLLPSIW